ncbi:phage minor capsid protein [Limosilactobacillus reuteri]|uniref:phage minor capsid protein n=1 Tax=Limosilactobacillus reuteri TaxID=1598 RepID=UPI002B05C205|nr:phage minor capsid protein [Limosilactobacillus reuteri]
MLKINCRHRLFPFVPGVNENHQPQYDPEKAIANGKLVQKQRARERAIRDAKHRLVAAKELGDEEQITKCKTLIRARQANMRDFIHNWREYPHFDKWGMNRPPLKHDSAFSFVLWYI